jgi:hypothetical protein
MTEPDDNSATWNLWLAVCWIGGVVLAVLVTLALSFGQRQCLAFVLDDVLKWMGQILGPICLLVLSQVFGLAVVKQFRGHLNRKQVYVLAMVMSLVYLGFTIGTIFAAGHVDDAGKDIAEVKLRQLQVLQNSGTTILVVLLWPILSMLLDYLFPKAEPVATSPGSPLSAPQ